MAENKIQRLVAISGTPDLYLLVGSRPNGIIAEDLKGDKKKFFSARKHQFSPLESISIYTYSDTVELFDVFLLMREKENEYPLEDTKASNSRLREYFRGVLEDHDEDRVRTTDIKKLIKWFKIIKENDLFSELEAYKTETKEEV